MPKILNKYLKAILLGLTTGLSTWLIPKVLDWFWAHSSPITKSQYLAVVLLLLNLTLALIVVAFEIISFVKNYREKHKFIKKRFGILWKYAVTKDRFPDIYATTDEITGREPIPYCPKHRIKLTNCKFMQEKDNPPLLLNWHCEECDKIIQPMKEGESDTTSFTGSEAISRMRKFFNRI